jgi:hypothetical protein
MAVLLVTVGAVLLAAGHFDVRRARPMLFGARWIGINAPVTVVCGCALFVVTWSMRGALRKCSHLLPSPNWSLLALSRAWCGPQCVGPPHGELTASGAVGRVSRPWQKSRCRSAACVGGPGARHLRPQLTGGTWADSFEVCRDGEWV